MKQTLVSLAALLIILNSCGSGKQDADSAAFKSAYQEVKTKFAPDGRSRTFEIDLEKEGNKHVLRGATTEPQALEALKESLKAKGFDILDSTRILPDASLGDSTYGVTAQSVINFRTSGKYSAESATQTLMGTPLRLLEKKGGWTRAVTPEGYIAWVSSGSIAEMDKPAFDAYTAAPKVIVTDKYAVITEKPDPNSRAVGDAVWGNILLDKGTSGKYRKVSIADGRTGYLPESQTEPFGRWLDSRNPTPDNLIATAEQFIGVPYLWGGTSIKAVDCSGFTKSVYYLNGIILARDASQQCYTGEDIDISGYVDQKQYTRESLKNLKKGDLIFFGRKATPEKKEHASHVGIYIGDGVFIHSATKVRINSLLPEDDNYYDNSVTLLRARRMLGNVDKDSSVTSIRNSVYISGK